MASYREVGFYLGGAISAKCYAALLDTGAYPQAFLLSAGLALAAAVMFWALYGQRLRGTEPARELAPGSEPVAS
jgi:nitrate/nitrite transporter NarK